MRIIFLIFNLIFCSLSLMAQTTQDFLDSCIHEELEKGATSIILKATLCSACRGEVTYDGFIFIKESPEIYKVRYLKYIHRPASVKVIKDKTFTDSKVKEIFEIVETYQDSILWQLSNIEGLLTDTIIENGQKIYEKSNMHGKLRYLRININGNSVTSLQSIVNLNSIFERAYYYWLLNSSINNYCNDHGELPRCDQ